MQPAQAELLRWMTPCLVCPLQWYKRQVDPEFDVDWVAPPPAAATASTAASAAAGAARSAAEGVTRAAQSAAAAARSAAASAAGRAGVGAGGPARASPTGELVLLCAHVAMLVTAVLSLQPLSRFLAWQAYFMFCRTAVVASGYKASPWLSVLAWTLLVEAASVSLLAAPRWRPDVACMEQPHAHLWHAELVATALLVPHVATGRHADAGQQATWLAVASPLLGLLHTYPLHRPLPLQVYLRHGLPPLRPFPSAAAPWLHAVAQSPEFFHFLVATLLLQVPQLWVGMAPLLLAVAPPTLTALGSRFGGHPLWARYGRPAKDYLDRAQVGWRH